MRKIVSRRGKPAKTGSEPLPEIDFQFYLGANDDEDHHLPLPVIDPSSEPDQGEFEYFHADWDASGLRMVTELEDAKNEWDCYFSPRSQIYWIKADNPVFGFCGFVKLPIETVQSMKGSIKDWIQLTMAHKEKS